MKKYKYPGKCPRCGCPRTGEIVYGFDTSIRTLYYYHALAKRKGIVLKYKEGMPDVTRTAFCDECGVEWRGDFQNLILEKEQWHALTGLESQTALGIDAYMRQQKKLRKKEKRIKKKQGKTGVFRRIRRFLWK